MAKAKNVHVLHEFRGRKTNEKPIYAGVYAPDDPRLLGLGRYLVKQELAVYTDAEPMLMPDNLEPMVPQRVVRAFERNRVKDETRKATGRELPDSAVIDPNTPDEPEDIPEPEDASVLEGVEPELEDVEVEVPDEPEDEPVGKKRRK